MTNVQYHYLAAWSVAGGVALAPEEEPRELAKVDGGRFVLAPSLASCTYKLDEALAATDLLLLGKLKDDQTDFVSVLRKRAGEIRAERDQTVKYGKVLVFEAEGEIATTAPRRGELKERDGYVVGWEFVDKKLIATGYRDVISSMKAAIGLSFSQLIRFVDLVDDSYMTIDGKIMYSRLLLRGPAWVTGGGYDPSGSVFGAISANFQLVHGATYLNRVCRLYHQMATSKQHPVRAYLLGWTAFEILLTKAFAAYETEFFASAGSGWQPALRSNFINSIRKLLGGKYRADEKVKAVSAVLFADRPAQEVGELVTRIKQMKDLRDQISHGQDFEEDQLPINQLDDLLRKYLVAALRRGAQNGSWPVSKRVKGVRLA